MAHGYAPHQQVRLNSSQLSAAKAARVLAADASVCCADQTTSNQTCDPCGAEQLWGNWRCEITCVACSAPPALCCQAQLVEQYQGQTGMSGAKRLIRDCCGSVKEF